MPLRLMDSSRWPDNSLKRDYHSVVQLSCLNITCPSSLRSTFRIVAQKYFSREEASITSDTNSRAMTPFQRAYLGNALISP